MLLSSILMKVNGRFFLSSLQVFNTKSMYFFNVAVLNKHCNSDGDALLCKKKDLR